MTTDVRTSRSLWLSSSVLLSLSLSLARALALGGAASARAAPAAAARAPGAERRIAVVKFDGAGELEVRRSVMRAIGAQGVALVGSRELDAASQARGGGRVDGDAMGTLAVEMRVVGLVDGHVIARARGGGASVRLVVRSAREGTLIATETFAVRGGLDLLARHVEENFWRRLGPAVERALTGAGTGGGGGAVAGRRPPPGAPPPRGSVAVSRTAAGRSEAGSGREEALANTALAAARARELSDPIDLQRSGGAAADRGAAAPSNAPDAPGTPPAPAGGTTPGDDVDARTAAASGPPPMLDVSLGPRFFSRRLSYNTDPQGVLREFQTRSWTPGMGLGVAFFPLSGRRLPAQPGLTLDLERGLSLESRTAMNRIYQSPAGDYRASIAVRLPHRLVTPEGSVGVGYQGFAFEPQGAARADPAPIPDVGYTYLRLGLGARVHTRSPLGVVVGAYYRHVFDAGAVASPEWFQRLSVHGLEVSGGLTYRFFPRWEVRADVGVRRYAFDLNTQPGDAREGDEATDIYWAFSFGVAMLLGTPSAAGTTP